MGCNYLNLMCMEKKSIVWLGAAFFNLFFSLIPFSCYSLANLCAKACRGSGVAWVEWPPAIVGFIWFVVALWGLQNFSAAHLCHYAKREVYRAIAWSKVISISCSLGLLIFVCFGVLWGETVAAISLMSVVFVGGLLGLWLVHKKNTPETIAKWKTVVHLGWRFPRHVESYYAKMKDVDEA